MRAFFLVATVVATISCGKKSSEPAPTPESAPPIADKTVPAPPVVEPGDAAPELDASLEVEEHPCPDGLEASLAAQLKVPPGHVRLDVCVPLSAPPNTWAVVAWSGNPDHSVRDVIRLIATVGNGKSTVVAKSKAEDYQVERTEPFGLQVADLDADGSPELVEVESHDGGGYSASRLNVFCRAGRVLKNCLSEQIDYTNQDVGGGCGGEWALVPDLAAGPMTISMTRKRLGSADDEDGAECPTGKRTWRLEKGRMVRADSAR